MNIFLIKLVVAVITLVLLVGAVVTLTGASRRSELLKSSAAGHETSQELLPGSYGTMLNTLNSTGGQ